MMKKKIAISTMAILAIAFISRFELKAREVSGDIKYTHILLDYECPGSPGVIYKRCTPYWAIVACIVANQTTCPKVDQ